MAAGGLLDHEATTFGLENLGLNIPDNPGVVPRVTCPQHSVRTSQCFKGISQQILTQEETRVSDSDDNQPEAPEHSLVDHPQRTCGKKSKCTKVRSMGDC